MESRRSALIVAADDYADPKLRRLRAPVRDAEELARVLADDAIGAFDVEILLNEPEYRVRRKVSEFFSNRTREDLLLVHFSCHGLKDDDGILYFATPDTEMDHLDSTAVPSEFVNRQMRKSRSRRIALFLDCCYSGAFSRGAMARAGEGVELAERFDGQGQVVITASNAMEYAFEGDELTGEGTPSVFTTALVSGLESGEADRDGDDLVSIDELYDYVYDKVREKTPEQTPSKWTYDLQGELYVAQNPHPRPVSAAELPDELRHALESPLAGVRVGVVGELERLVSGSNARLVAAARLGLETLTDDDSRSVSDAATAALARSRSETVEAGSRDFAEDPRVLEPTSRTPLASPSLLVPIGERSPQTAALPATAAPASQSLSSVLHWIAYGPADPSAQRPIWWASTWPTPRSVAVRGGGGGALLLLADRYLGAKGIHSHDWYMLGVAVGITAGAALIAMGGPVLTSLATGALLAFGLQTIGSALNAGDAVSALGAAAVLAAAVIALRILVEPGGAPSDAPAQGARHRVAAPLAAVAGAALWISALFVPFDKPYDSDTDTLGGPFAPGGTHGLALLAIACTLVAALLMRRSERLRLVLVGALLAVGAQTLMFFATLARTVRAEHGFDALRVGAGLGLAAGVAIVIAGWLAYRAAPQTSALPIPEGPTAG